MKKTSISTEDSQNRLSYLDSYDEIMNYKKTKKKKSKYAPVDIILPKKVRWFIFVLFFFIQTMINVDHGTIPAATNDIKDSLKIDDYILGVFGSLVFLGNLMGI